MENNQDNKTQTTKKQSFTKLWPLWLALAAIVAIVLINAHKGRGLACCPLGDKNSGEFEAKLSGKALSLVHQSQYFSASSFGKKMPDFKVTALNGKELTLSSLIGKQVMIVCWATWCPPCREEIPHIAKLRGEIASDKLEIIGLSFENPEIVRNFVQNSEINYTVATSSPELLPEPISKVTALPTIIFLDEKANIKVAAQGGISFEQMKAIIEAK